MDVLLGADVDRDGYIIESVVAEDLVPYTLRHTDCTDLQNAGVPLNVARYLMGHSKIELTARIYTHTDNITLNKAADLIAKHADSGATVCATHNTHLHAFSDNQTETDSITKQA